MYYNKKNRLIDASVMIKNSLKNSQDDKVGSITPPTNYKFTNNNVSFTPDPFLLLTKPTTNKKRITFFLSSETEDALRLVEIELRKLARNKGIKESRTNRSWIMEASLLITLQDFVNSGERSVLAGFLKVLEN